MLVDLGDLMAHYAPYGWLLAVLVVPLGAICTVGVTTLRGAAAGPPAGAAERQPQPTWATQPTRALLVAGAVLAAFLGLYVFLMFYHDDLVGIDYAPLTANRFVSVAVWPASGRFFPLALQQYNLISLLGVSAPLYHAWAALELVVVVACVFYLLRATPAWYRCVATLFMLVLPSVAYSFFNLVYVERDMLFWLGLWLVCLQSFRGANGRLAFCGSLVAAQMVLYHKETAFALIGGSAITSLVLNGWRNAALLKARRYGAFVRAHAMELGHLTLCAVFLAVYLVVIAPQVTASYVTRPGSLGAAVTAIAQYARSDLVLVAAAVALAWRLVSAAAGRRVLDPVWDPLAAGALAFALAYVKLGLVREYYLAPADFVAALYLARLGYETLRGERRVIVAGVALVTGWAFQQNAGDAATQLLARRLLVDGHVQLESFLKRYSRTTGRSDLTLFFPQVGGFQVMEFAAFLRYKGWRPGDERPAAGSGEVTFVIKRPQRAFSDRCHPSQPIRCLAAPAPQAGELVVFLPGQWVPDATLADQRTRAVEVFHHVPRWSMVGRALRAVASSEQGADGVTDAYVFRY